MEHINRECGQKGTFLGVEADGT